MFRVMTEITTINTICDNIKNYNLEPPYQRKADAWTDAQRKMLVDSVLRGYLIPEMFMHDKVSHYDVIDGANRIRTFHRFYKNNLRLPKDIEPIDGVDIGGMYFSDLPEKLQKAFKDRNITLRIVQCVNMTEIEEALIISTMFRRLGSGTDINKTEKRHAYVGYVRDLIVESAKHPVFAKINKSPARYGYEQIAAQWAALVFAGGYGDIRNVTIDKIYREYADGEYFKTKGGREILNTFQWVLDFTNLAFENESKLLRIVPMVSWVNLLCDLKDVYSLERVEQKLGSWYLKFLGEIAVNETLPPSDRDPGLQYFNISNTHNNPNAQRTKVEYLKQRLQADHNLSLLFKQNGRYFTEKQRIAIYYRANGQCESDEHVGGREIRWGEWQAHHIIPYSKGGKTELPNGQCLCVDCHKKIHAS